MQKIAFSPQFLNRLRSLLHNNLPAGWLGLVLTGAVICQVAALLTAEGLYLVPIARDLLDPGYSYDTMLGREIDVEFLRICQQELPPTAVALNLVNDNARYRYHLYPLRVFHLPERWRTDEVIADNIVQYQITHILVWEAQVYEASRLLQDERLFESHDYGGGRMILVVSSAFKDSAP